MGNEVASPAKTTPEESESVKRITTLWYDPERKSLIEETINFRGEKEIGSLTIRFGTTHVNKTIRYIVKGLQLDIKQGNKTSLEIDASLLTPEELTQITRIWIKAIMRDDSQKSQQVDYKAESGISD